MLNFLQYSSYLSKICFILFKSIFVVLLWIASGLPGGLVVVLLPTIWEVPDLNPGCVRKGIQHKTGQTFHVNHSILATLNREQPKWKFIADFICIPMLCLLI